LRVSDRALNYADYTGGQAGADVSRSIIEIFRRRKGRDSRSRSQVSVQRADANLGHHLTWTPVDARRSMIYIRTGHVTPKKPFPEEKGLRAKRTH
jgi:hypothetical protein